MRAVIQRVSQARVRAGGRITGEIGRGLVVFVGVSRDDGEADVRFTVGKIRDIRIFESAEGRLNDRSVADVGGSILLVSQFTLYGDVRRGRRPSFDEAAPPERARQLYENLVRELRATAIPVATGEFQASMDVELVNDGPVTILLDSRRRDG
jgi:D-tyrosyl-tRNA(Tyr) deacylase